jgi:hypothetical protein
MLDRGLRDLLGDEPLGANERCHAASNAVHVMRLEIQKQNLGEEKRGSTYRDIGSKTVITNRGKGGRIEAMMIAEWG